MKLERIYKQRTPHPSWFNTKLKYTRNTNSIKTVHNCQLRICFTQRRMCAGVRAEHAATKHGRNEQISDFQTMLANQSLMSP